jgi:hypothetical protein
VTAAFELAAPAPGAQPTGESTMRLVSTAVLLTALLGLAACSYVDGNYPPLKTEAVALPDEWKNSSGEAMPVVWQLAPELRGFFVQWLEPERLLPMVREGAQSGDPLATRELENLEELNRHGLCVAVVAVFMDRGFERRLPQGSLTLDFADATSIRDSGIVFDEPHKKGPRRHSSRSGPQTIKGKYTNPGEPLMVGILVPKEHLGKTVTKVR